MMNKLPSTFYLRHFKSSPLRAFSTVTLSRNQNQARALGEYALDFMKMDHKKIDEEVYKRV